MNKLTMNKLTVLVTAVLFAGGVFAATYTYTGGDVYQKDSWNNDWLDIKDRKDGTTYLWSSSAAPTAGNNYLIDNTYPNVWFKIQSDNSKTFPGDSLTINGSTVTVDAQERLIRLTVNNLAVEAGARLDTKTYGSYENYAHGLWLTGTPRIDGTLRVYHKVRSDINYYGAYLSGGLTGSGNVELRGDNMSNPRRHGSNWRIAGDNGGFKGKFVFRINEAMSGGESFATGVEIKNANALGGARDSFTPDAVEIKSWNGLVTVDNDITLNAANSGILMQTNSFFEVPANRVLVVAEPIRLTGGFFKKGAGTLALNGGFAFGSDGSAAADGFNSALAVKEGVLRVTSASDLADLDVSMVGGSLELVGTTTATFRSLSAAGALTIVVDCTGLVAGSTQTITLNMPQSDAEALVGRVDVTAKGVYATIGSDLTVTPTGATITLKVPSVTTWHNYTGTSGYSKYSTDWDAVKDGDDPTKYLWDNNVAAVPTDGYTVNMSAFFNSSTTMFNGGALHVKGSGKTLEVLQGDSYGLTVSNLTVDAGATFKVGCKYRHADHPTWLRGDLWRIDGTLNIVARGPSGYWCPTVPMIGNGLVSFTGRSDEWTTKSLDQRLDSDNSRFRGKFKVQLPKTQNGAEMAAGLRIVDARALGGALGVMTPDALTLAANNGLIAGESLVLAAENRGILMYTNAYFEVESGKTLTLKEPIRVVNGILKKGSGTLVLGGDVTIGTNGTTSPNGTNNKLTVQAGTIKAASTNGIAKLAFDFASGTKLELDAFPTDDGVRVGGFYFTGDTPFIAADAKIPLNVAFPDSYTVETSVDVVLCTVNTENVDIVRNKLSIATTGLAHQCSQSFLTEDLGNGLSRIRCKFSASGFILTVW